MAEGIDTLSDYIAQGWLEAGLSIACIVSDH
jgi:hypothetical protein